VDNKLDDIIRGLSSTLAEKEDHIVVPDLRGKGYVYNLPNDLRCKRYTYKTTSEGKYTTKLNVKDIIHNYTTFKIISKVKDNINIT
jgi:hypothetical protein